MKTISEITRKMIVCSAGNLHDIHHFMKVWAYARLIGESEGLEEKTQLTLEIAAITHDIACPLCRKKYGSTAGPLQEREGALIVREFLADTGLEQEMIDRVSYLVGHHHTYHPVDGLDYRILLEADYLVNADESGYPYGKILEDRETVFLTRAGMELLDAMYLNPGTK